MESLTGTAAEFGAVMLLFVLMLLGLWSLAKWLMVNGVLPLVQSAVAYLQGQTDFVAHLRDDMQKITLLESEIKEALKRNDQNHFDETSAFSNVKTHKSIVLLSKAVERIAESLEIDIKDLIAAIERVVEKD